MFETPQCGLYEVINGLSIFGPITSQATFDYSYIRKSDSPFVLLLRCEPADVSIGNRNFLSESLVKVELLLSNGKLVSGYMLQSNFPGCLKHHSF